MSDDLLHKVLVGTLIPVLHLPLIFFTLLLHDGLEAGQGLTDLGPVVILVLLVLTAMPYAVLTLLNIQWNPAHARLGEYDC